MRFIIIESVLGEHKLAQTGHSLIQIKMKGFLVQEVHIPFGQRV